MNSEFGIGRRIDKIEVMDGNNKIYYKNRVGNFKAF
jgi:hypothetical protein